jgi:hypothetical protein
MLAAAICLLAVLTIMLYTVPYTRLSYAQTTFPPPVFLQLRNIPSYSVMIPYTTSGIALFEPSEMAIPVE